MKRENKIKSTVNNLDSITLTYFIYIDWIRDIITSTLAFDIVQFFPSLNHCLLSYILSKASFDSKIEYFFSNYLVERKT